MEKKNLNCIKYSVLALTLVNLALFIAYIIVTFTVIVKEDSKANIFIGNKQISLDNNRVSHDITTGEFKISDSKKKDLLRGTIGKSLDLDDYESIKTTLDKTGDYTIEYKGKKRINSVKLSVKNSHSDKDNHISCKTHEWTISNEYRTDFAEQEFEDCFNLDNHWYGGAEAQTQQFWPINDVEFPTHLPYLTGLFGKWSSIIERYWLSSSGVAIIGEHTNPLFVLKNKLHLCLLAKSKEPYPVHLLPTLKYDVCQSDKEKSPNDFLNKLQLFVINNYFNKPSALPDLRMMKSPIWSTWANFKSRINESVVLGYARDIVEHGYPNSQLEIDDKWTKSYGDLDFDREKFPDPKNFTDELKRLGFRVTAWIHPFFNVDSTNFLLTSFAFLAVRAPDRLHPSITSWWQGEGAVILDTTNRNSTAFFVAGLNNLKRTSGLDSFKFDAGEVEWLARGFSLTDESAKTPDEYAIQFCRMSAKLGNLIEVRVGTQTQDLPIFVRMLDKDSNWGYDNGLKSVITTALVMSVLGYPFILPDMIGGNAYTFIGDNIDFNADTIAYPDKEVYIRWAQVTAFLPSMQFSIPPWHYGDEVDRICKELVEIHENLVYPLLEKYGNLAVQNGSPIIRPMWWVDNSDEKTHVIADQFLVGDEIMVAPVTDDKTYQRDIYIPKGTWISQDGKEYNGPILIKDHPAPIETINYFLLKTQ